MKLYLSEDSPLNSVYTNEAGQVLYKVETSTRAFAPTSNISCVIPNDVPKAGEDNAAVSMQDRFAYYAHVKHNVISSAVLHFGGEQFEAKDYFRKGSWGAYGRDRVFTGRDGREYKWVLQSFSPGLFTNDATATPVAKFDVKRYGIIGKARPASLEIYAPGEHMIQEIFVTFIYIEKMRKDREIATQS